MSDSRRQSTEKAPDLRDAVLRALRGRVGQENVIERAHLVGAIRRMGFAAGMNYATLDRKVRETIRDLRRDGELICSTSGGGGYWIAKTWEEYNEFSLVEYRGKIADMAQTLAAMDAAAERKFGTAHQPALF
jgi:hypothetical protein